MGLANWIALSVLTIVFAWGPTVALADDQAEPGLILREGEWVFDVKIRLPLQTAPNVQKIRTCQAGEPVTASGTLMPWAKEQGCKIRSPKVDGDKLSWKIRCRRDGQKSRGSGKFTADGDRAEGKATIKFEVAGQRMSIVTVWEAERVGDCPGSASAQPAPSSSPADSSVDAP